MAEARGGVGAWRSLAWLLALSALCFGAGLGGSSRLTYHEAFVAQGAREILQAGEWRHPTIGGRPWLEKPPLPFWLVAAAGRLAGGVDERSARVPSALAATGLVLAVAVLVGRRRGAAAGLLAGAVQATTAWTVLRGRLAEADVLLACLVAWSFVAFDRLRSGGGGGRAWRWAFFALLGLTSLVKGVGFGAALVVAGAAATLLWDRDRPALARLGRGSAGGWLAAGAIGLAWPLAMVAQHGPGVLSLWFLHVAGRVGDRTGHGPFAGEGWGEYAVGLVGQALPWAPVALVGAVASLGLAWRGRGGLDRLLWAWAAVPLVLVSLPGGRNAHYAIHAMVPWSAWAALGLERLGRRLVRRRGWPAPAVGRLGYATFAGLGAAYAVGFALVGPRVDRREAESAFYAEAGRRADGAGAGPVVLLYDDWDREPYPTPFGPIPHDSAVRLFYLGRPACWHRDPAELAPHGHGGGPLTLIGRERDLPALGRLGEVEVLSRGPAGRWDRAYLLARLRPAPRTGSRPGEVWYGDLGLAVPSPTGLDETRRPGTPPLMEPFEYDLIVIGSGPAGENGAATAASFGKRVALVERNAAVGGASTNTGTLPSKTLRETALAISGLRARDLYGVDLSLRREATVADLMFHEEHVKVNARRRVAQGLARRGVPIFRGTATFVGPHTVRVVAEPGDAGADGPGPEPGRPAEMLLRGEKVLIATGSSPVRPPGFPFEHDRVHDSDEILQLAKLPHSMVVVGAGVIGCEYACTFAALGTKVWIVDGRDELLPFLDRELSAALEQAMTRRLGITFLWQRKVTGCTAPEAGDITLTFDWGGPLKADSVLVAAGRASNTGALNLAAAGLVPGPRGLLPVDADFRTAVPHIYAAGDVIGFPALASTSAEQARVAMCHAFCQGHSTAVAPVLPTGIYSIPEVAMVGTAEEDLAAKGVDYVVGRAYYAENARGEIVGDVSGFLKLIFRRDDMTLLGVHVLGEQATEVVHIGLMAMLTGGSAELLNRACFNYPTLGDLYRQAAADALDRRDAEATTGG